MQPMFFDVLLFLFDGIILLTGYLVKYHSTEYPDTCCGFHAGNLYGKSESAWKEANRYSGSVFLTSGLVVLVLDAALAVTLNRYPGALEENSPWAWALIVYLGMTVVAPALLGIFCTERRLKRLFNADGSEKKTLGGK